MMKYSVAKTEVETDVMEMVICGKVTLFRLQCPDCGEYNMSGTKKFECENCRTEYTERSEHQKTIILVNTKRGMIPAKIKDKLFRQQSGRCAYCGRKFGTTILRKERIRILSIHGDHFKPYSYTNTNNDDNWVLSCSICNLYKSSKLFDNISLAADFVNSKWDRDLFSGVTTILIEPEEGIDMAKLPKLKKPSIKWLDFLWSVLIKAIAGFRSELSGGTDGLSAHHLAGKPNHALRYMVLDNGICITNGEHKFGYHHTGRAEQYRLRTQALRGNDIYERLETMKHQVEKRNLFEIETTLLSRLKQYEDSISQYYQAKDYKTKSVISDYKKLFTELEKINN